MENDDKWSGRQLLQAHEQNVTDAPDDGGQLYVRNCTEPGRNEKLPLAPQSCSWLPHICTAMTYLFLGP